MKIVRQAHYLMVATLSAAFLAQPAHCQITQAPSPALEGFTNTCNIGGSGFGPIGATDVLSYDTCGDTLFVSLQDFINAGFYPLNPFANTVQWFDKEPLPNTPMTITKTRVAVRNDGYRLPIKPSPPVTTIETPVTITDTSTGESSTVQAVVSIVGVAADIAAFYDVPLAAEVGIGLSVFSFVTDTYGPVTSAVYAGVDDFVTGVINAGVGQMNAHVVPIGPDPKFDFAFTVEATTFTGSFDAIGPITNISDIHDVSLFVDGIPATGANDVPEPSTWTMLVIGLVGLVLTRRAYKTTNGMPTPSGRKR